MKANWKAHQLVKSIVHRRTYCRLITTLFCKYCIARTTLPMKTIIMRKRFESSWGLELVDFWRQTRKKVRFSCEMDSNGSIDLFGLAYKSWSSSNLVPKHLCPEPFIKIFIRFVRPFNRTPFDHHFFLLRLPALLFRMINLSIYISLLLDHFKLKFTISHKISRLF